VFNAQASERPGRVARYELALASTENCSALSRKCHIAMYHEASAPTRGVGLSRRVQYRLTAVPSSTSIYSLSI
jgi:hypothetical protein